MVQLERKQVQVTEKDLIDEIELSVSFQDVELFFEKEKKMLRHLYKIEKKEAQRDARKLIDYMLNSTEEYKLKSIKYYFVVLSSIVTRYLVENQLTQAKAYSFNVACIRFIEQNLAEENMDEVADELIEFFTYVLAGRKLPSLQHSTVNNVIDYIDKDLESIMTVEGIAEKFDVSMSHLSRVFREHTGVTLVEYINIRKVEEAQYYLRFSDMQILGISDQFHFCNQSYFTRIFKKYTGETPRRFRHNIETKYFRFTFPDEE